MALRVEAKPVATSTPVVNGSADHWRGLAVQTGERLGYAENQLKDLRRAADENRARLTKAKERLDAANARINDLQAQVVTQAAELEVLRAKVASQAQIKRVVWDLAQQAKDGIDRGVSDVLATL